MIHYNSQRAEECEEAYGDEYTPLIDNLPSMEGMKAAYLIRRSRRQTCMPKKKPSEEIRLNPRATVINAEVEHGLRMERRMDAMQALAESAILETEQPVVEALVLDMSWMHETLDSQTLLAHTTMQEVV